jgi:hypothetical protein
MEFYKTQSQINQLAEQEKINYIKNKWISEKFKSKDLIATNNSQPCQYISMDPKFMFVIKFLKKRNKRLQQSKCIKYNEDDNNSIPQKYFELLESEIFNKTTNTDKRPI